MFSTEWFPSTLRGAETVVQCNPDLMRRYAATPITGKYFGQIKVQRHRTPNIDYILPQSLLPSPRTCLPPLLNDQRCL